MPKPRTAAACALGAALIAAALAPAAPAETPAATRVSALPDRATDWTGRFEVFFGGLRAGYLDMSLEADADSYVARTRAEASSFLGTFVTAFVDAKTIGERLPDGRVRPDVFQADSRFGDDRQAVEIAYDDDRPLKVVGDPEFIPKPYQVDPTEQVGALDPLSAGLTLIAPRPAAEACGRKAEFFDGRRRYDILFGDATRTKTVLRCDGIYRRVAGFKPKQMNKQRDFPFTIEFDIDKDGLARVREVSIPFEYSTLVVRRR